MKNRHFLLVIVCLLSIKGPLTSTSAGTGISPNDLILSTEDYTIFEDSSTPIVPVIKPTNAGTLQRCDYNACREKQTPCEVLSASLGCLCPGFTLHNEHPEPPSLSSVSWNGSAVVVWWCAPNSYITSYVVTVEGGEKQTLRADQRRAALSQIDHKAEVCVVAVNDAGDSARSCMEYQPSSNSLALIVGLIGGTLGFLLLILLAVLLCRRRRQKREEARHV